MTQNGTPNVMKIGITCTIEELTTIVKKWQSRTEKCEDLDYYLSLGGDNWLLNNLMTSNFKGIREKSIPKRMSKYGSNLVIEVPPPCKLLS
jgi:hypothetical protein